MTMAPAESKIAVTDLVCNLPAFRPVAVKILKVLSRESADLAEVTRILESDPAFSAEVLTLANSPLYAGYSQINSVLRAVVVLGADRVKSLTMTAALRAFVRNLPQTAELRSCWRHSRASALMAEELAPTFNIQPDRAYTAGLMHDVGRFGLLSSYSALYCAMVATEFESPAEALQGERDSFGFDHAEAGARLTRTWLLPATLAHAAAVHHNQEEVLTGLPALVRASCLLASVLGFPAARYRRQPDAESLVQAISADLRAEELRCRLEQKFNSLDLG